MRFGERIFGGFKKAKEAVVASPVVNNPVMKNLGESYDHDPVKTVGVGVSLIAGAAGLVAGAAKLSEPHELLTPAEPATKERPEQVSPDAGEGNKEVITATLGNRVVGTYERSLDK